MTLTEASLATRRGVKLLALGFVGFVIIKAVTGIIIPLIPKPGTVIAIPTPDVAFGQLGAIQLKPLAIKQITVPSFSLDLTSSILPDKPVQVPVYPIILAPYGFLTKDRAFDQARKFFFFSEPQDITPTEFLWNSLARILKMGAANLNFTYHYDYNNDPTIFDKSGSFVSAESAKALGLNIMSSRGLLGGGDIFGGTRGADLIDGKITTQLLRYNGNKLVPSQSLAETHAVRLDFFRKNLGDYPLVTPHFNEGLVYLVFSGKTDDPGNQKFYQIADLGFTYWVIKREQSAVYPLIKSIIAWGMLQNNYKEYLVSLTPDDGSVFGDQIPEVISLTAREAYLAYYDSDISQGYMQPVWVFTGKANIAQGKTADWAAYVPAIEEEWIRK
ncbi:MAG: hypothetical protein UT37_C0009G0025 [Parcubacteria group bacterium GW2011_GWA2_39_18]|nr:MAG: hypothetical protein UT37_C0009G0025 [Parcubacteria group bacterium GW2011_GWA2_39_18]